MLINSYRFAAASGGTYDTGAQAYITAVEAADGASLETATRDAINAFVVGCKADGIWAAIKASCILAGARTLAGALVPLVGTAPTNVGGLFVAGDYNRKTGLVGDGTSKNLLANRVNNADPQDNRHISVYATAIDTRTSTHVYIGSPYGNGWTALLDNAASTIQVWVGSNNGAVQRISNTAGFIGAARSSSAVITARSAGTATPFSQTSQVPTSVAIGVFANGNSSERSTARLAFYSIGESLDLALLDTRVTALITAFSTAIP